MHWLRKLLKVVLVAACCTLMGGVGAYVAVTEVPSVREALRGEPGPQGVPGITGERGPAGPVGAQGAPGEDGTFDLYGAYVVGDGCPYGTTTAGTVVTDATLIPPVRDFFTTSEVWAEATLQTSTMDLCLVN